MNNIRNGYIKKIGITFLFIVLLVGIGNAEQIKGKVMVYGTEENRNFQRLSDVYLFNNTEIIPKDIVDNILIPKGFYDSLEKNISADEIQKNQWKKQRISEILKPESNHIGDIKDIRDIKNIKNDINDIGINDINVNINSDNDIIFSGNYVPIWNISVKGAIFDYVQVVPDLNGDSLKDMLATIYRYDLNTGLYYYTVQARKGKDKTLLWQDTISGKNIWAYGYPAGDVNGDGLYDILVNSLRYDPIKNTYYQQIKIKNGKNGTTLWQELYTLKNSYLLLKPVKDLNGDKSNDLLISTINYSAHTGLLKAKKGSNGVILWKDFISNGTIYDGYPVGDLNGDGLNDIVEEIKNLDTGQKILKAKKGSNGVNLWQISIPGSGYIYGDIAGDLDGDRLNDIIIEIKNGQSILMAKKGSNGALLWQESGEFAYPVKDLNGDGLNDVIVDQYQYNTEILNAKKGINGATLWEESINVAEGNIYLESPLGDLTGDKINDILIEIFKDNGDRTLKAKKGSNGALLWQERIPDNSWFGESKIVQDLNRDGIKDVIVEIHNGSNITIKAKKGSNGAILWKEFVTNGYIYWSEAGDLTGDKSNEILLKIHNYIIYENTIKVKNGTNGATLWQRSVSYPLNIDGIATGDINGDKLNDIILSIVDREYVSPNFINKYTALLMKKGSNGVDIWKAEFYGAMNVATVYIPLEFYYGIQDELYWIYGDKYPRYDLNGNGYSDILLNIYNEIYLMTAKH